jgi:hypothetical protein
MVCTDGGPLCTIPMNTTSESSSTGERLRLLKQSVMKYMLPNHMVSPGVSLTLVEFCYWQQRRVLVNNHQNVRSKAHCKCPLPGVPIVGVFCTGK